MQDPIAVVGDGSWMRMIARLLRANNIPVLVWPGVASDGMPADAPPDALLRMIGARDGVTVVESPAPLADTRLVFLATSPWRMRASAIALADHLHGYHRLIHTVRGIESTTLLRASEVLRDETPVRQIGALVGPSHPSLHDSGQPGACVIGSTFPELIRQTQEALGNPTFRVYGNRDLIGVELAAAAARLLSVAVGMVDGMGIGPAVRGTLIARGGAEMARLGAAVGAQASTFTGIAGLGYVVAQASEPIGADLQIGRALAAGDDPDTIQTRFGPDAVDLFTSASTLTRLTQARRVEAHIITTIERVLNREYDVPTAARHLLSLSQMME